MSPAWRTTDEYVWLDGRPLLVLLVLLGRLDASTDVRAADTSTSCGRNDEAQACGSYFIITDMLPKPVALLDAAGKHSRKLNWERFGGLNVTAVRGAETPHPSTHNQNTPILTVAPSIPSGMTSDYRFQIDFLDTEGTASSPVDYAGWMRVNFRSNACNCPPEGCLADGGLPDSGNWPYSGLSVVAYGTAERQVGANPSTSPSASPASTLMPRRASMKTTTASWTRPRVVTSLRSPCLRIRGGC